MMFGPAMIPMAWFILKGLWGEYTKRPPLWITYEPEQFPEVTYYDHICGIKYPEIFGGCEDIKVYGDYAIVSCDPYKKQSNFLTGYRPDTPSGNVYIWNYVKDTAPAPIDFGPDFGELRPQGVRGLYLPNENDQPATDVVRIFVANAAKNASVEVFDFTPATGTVEKVISLRHKDAVLDPAALAPISPTQVFLTNTLGYPYRSVLGPLEIISAIPFGTIGYLDFTNATNVTGKAVGASTTPIGMEYVDDTLYVASVQYGIYAYKLYIPPDDLTEEEIAANKSLGKMHFYPGEKFYRTPYLPTHITYSTELDSIVVAGINSYSGEVKAWFGRKSPSWAALLVNQTGPDGKPLVVSDSVTLGLRETDRKFQTLFWDSTGDKFSGLKSMVVENGRRFGVSPHQAGVLVCNTNGLETIEVPDTPATEGERAETPAQARERQRKSDHLEHMYLAKEEL
ncbi:uncharacterized protein V1513DRAFT_449644 [Lipomyces chichibuensis]|uniref:uncharacterized protein n=1 Tax=Lipomyces chichibuensis TaxID=1546026 RepID=UPI003343667F